MKRARIVMAVALLAAIGALAVLAKRQALVRAADGKGRLRTPPLAAARLPEKNPDREAYFGETHVHTSWSFDAYVFGNHLTGPAQAYEYALGQTIKHPLGYEIKITTALDWMG